MSASIGFLSSVPLSVASNQHDENNYFNGMLVPIRLEGLKALSRISPRLKDNPDFMLAVIKENGIEAIKYASERLRGTDWFVSHLIGLKGIDVLRFVDPELTKIDTFMFPIIRKTKNEIEFKKALREADISLLNNKKFIKLLKEIPDYDVDAIVEKMIKVRNELELQANLFPWIMAGVAMARDMEPEKRLARERAVQEAERRLENARVARLGRIRVLEA